MPRRRGRRTRPETLRQLLRVSYGDWVGTGLGGAAVVAVAVMVFGAFDQRHVWREPTERAVVTREELTGGELMQGRVGCAGADYELTLPAPRPDLPERTATVEECASDWTVGDRLDIRRVPGHPDRTYVEPLPAPLLAAFAAVAGIGAGAAVALLSAFVDVGAHHRSRRRRAP